MLRIFLLVQDEPFYLHKHLPVLFKRHKVVGASVLSQHLPGENLFLTFNRYLTLFGFVNFIKLGIKMAICRITGKGSLRNLLKKKNVILIETKQINCQSYVNKVALQKPDVLVSVACPQIIETELMAASKLGTINLHGGYLPDFPGVFSAFWNLFKGSMYAGCTVHFVSDQIDGGGIIGRKRFRIDSTLSMFEIYSKVVSVGIPLLVDCLDSMEIGQVKSIPNKILSENYNTFPTKAQAREFRKRGLRII